MSSYADLPLFLSCCLGSGAVQYSTPGSLIPNVPTCVNPLGMAIEQWDRQSNQREKKSKEEIIYRIWTGECHIVSSSRFPEGVTRSWMIPILRKGPEWELSTTKQNWKRICAWLQKHLDSKLRINLGSFTHIPIFIGTFLGQGSFGHTKAAAPTAKPHLSLSPGRAEKWRRVCVYVCVWGNGLQPYPNSYICDSRRKNDDTHWLINHIWRLAGTYPIIRQTKVAGTAACSRYIYLSIYLPTYLSTCPTW